MAATTGSAATHSRWFAFCCVYSDMNERADILAPIALPSPDAAAACVKDAQRLFERTLSGWAVDALTLRRTGACELHWRGAARHTSSSFTQYRKAA
jgi:hypothetical protein